MVSAKNVQHSISSQMISKIVNHAIVEIGKFAKRMDHAKLAQISILLELQVMMTVNV